jgi:hypothetical protein
MKTYFERGYRDVEEAYLENKETNPHHFHYYDSGMIAYKNEYIELYRRNAKCKKRFNDF